MTGVTLIEMLIVLLILGVLGAIAAPSFKSQIELQRAKSAATDIYIALVRARGETIKRNLDITLSPKNGNWTNGWQILDPVTGALLEDHDAVRNITVSGPASVVYQTSGRVQGAVAPTFHITGTYATSSRCVLVTLSGRPKTAAGTC